MVAGVEETGEKGMKCAEDLFPLKRVFDCECGHTTRLAHAHLARLNDRVVHNARDNDATCKQKGREERGDEGEEPALWSRGVVVNSAIRNRFESS